MVVDLDVVAKRRFELECGAKAGLIDDVADAAIEAFHHAVGLRMARRNEAMLDVGFLAKDVEYMLAAGYPLAFLIFLLAGKTVGKLTAIIGKQLDDLDRAGSPHLGQEVDTAAVGLVGINFHLIMFVRQQASESFFSNRALPA